MYTVPPERPLNRQLREDWVAATSHELLPAVALYVATLVEFGAKPNVTKRDVFEVPLTFTCDGAEKI